MLVSRWCSINQYLNVKVGQQLLYVMAFVVRSVMSWKKDKVICNLHFLFLEVDKKEAAHL